MNKKKLWWDDLFNQALASTFTKSQDGKINIYFEPLEQLLKLVEKTARVEAIKDCANFAKQEMAWGTGKEYSNAIRNKFLK